jgi:hypothetical protein
MRRFVKALAICGALVLLAFVIRAYAQSAIYNAQVVKKVSVSATSGVNCCVTLTAPSVDTDYLVSAYGISPSGGSYVGLTIVWNDGVMNEQMGAQLGEPSSTGNFLQTIHVASGQTLGYYYACGNCDYAGPVNLYLTVVKE